MSQINALRGLDGKVPSEKLAEFDELIRALGRERMRETFGDGPVYGYHRPENGEERALRLKRDG